MQSSVSAIQAERERAPLLICFSHLRWDFVFQRPQHLMRRFARTHRVVFWEEPIFDAAAPRLSLEPASDINVEVAVPHLPAGLSKAEQEAALQTLLDAFTADRRVAVRWYYTPMMLGFSRHLEAGCTVYDCMDELANFRFAPPELLPREAQLIEAADLVFPGGYRLYQAKPGPQSDVRPSPPHGAPPPFPPQPQHSAAARRALTHCAWLCTLRALPLPLVLAPSTCRPTCAAAAPSESGGWSCAAGAAGSRRPVAASCGTVSQMWRRPGLPVAGCQPVLQPGRTITTPS